MIELRGSVCACVCMCVRACVRGLLLKLHCRQQNDSAPRLPGQQWEPFERFGNRGGDKVTIIVHEPHLRRKDSQAGIEPDHSVLTN